MGKAEMVLAFFRVVAIITNLSTIFGGKSTKIYWFPSYKIFLFSPLCFLVGLIWKGLRFGLLLVHFF